MIAILLAAALTTPPPGALNPAVTQATIRQTICVTGWTKTIRPPPSYTNALKRKQLAALHVHLSMHDVEEDHFIPLEIGGNPTDPQNLWPQVWTGSCGAHAKDAVETRLKRQTCSGQITLAEAQAQMRAWPAHCAAAR